MKRKLSQAVTLSAVIAAAALTLVFATASSACIYNQVKGISDSVNPDRAPGSIDTAIDRSDLSSNSVSESSGFNSLSVAGVGLLAVASLVGGSLLLKVRCSRQTESTAQDHQATEQVEETFEPAAFAIVVPPEALSSLHEDREATIESELTRV